LLGEHSEQRERLLRDLELLILHQSEIKNQKLLEILLLDCDLHERLTAVYG